MRANKFVVGGIALLGACAETPQPAVQAQAAPEAAKATKLADAGEKRVCRRDETTGSIMPKVVCHSRSEWAQIDAQNGVGVDRFNQDRSRSPAGKLQD